jgi:tight adherence protein B
MLLTLTAVFAVLLVAGILISGFLGQSIGEMWYDMVRWIGETLDNLYLPLVDKKIKAAVLAVISVFFIIGFLLPGYSGVDRFLLNQAVELNRNQRHGQVLKLLSVIRNQNSPLLHNELGVAYLALGNASEAEHAFLKAVQILPTYEKAYRNLAVTYQHQGRRQEAVFADQKAKSAAQIPTLQEKVYGVQSKLVSLERLPSRVIVALIFSLFGFFLPRFVLKYVIRYRMERFDQLLPDGLLMISNALRAGLSFPQALEIVAKEAPKPLNQEFAMILKEHRLGLTVDDAMANLTRRITTTDTKIVVTAVMILRETGGNLAEIFDNMAQTMRERKKVKQKIKAMTAEGVSQSYMLAALPFVLGWFLNKFNTEVFSLLYTTFLGWVMIIFMILWGGSGVYMMRKIVQVKV